MDWTRVSKNPFFRPVLIALFLHLCFVALAMVVKIHGASQDVPQEDMLRFNVKSVDKSPMLLHRDASAANPNRTANSLKFNKRSKNTETSLPKDIPVETLMQGSVVPKDRDGEVIPKKVELSDPELDRSQDLNSILIRTEEKQQRENVEVHQKSTTTGVSEMMKMVEGHRSDAARLVQSLSTALKKVNYSGEGSVNVDPEEGMPGFTPMEGTFGNSDIDQALREGKGELLKYESLDDFLDIRVYTYQDPKDSQKYYMIKIFAKKNAKALKVMPKEILFTIDCSLSISPERLGEFKQGISHCLKNLNKDDVFNIVAFKDKAQLFRPASVVATPDVIKEAEKFVSELTSNRTTDVYNAFEKIVKSPLARKPSNIILISDGRPTHGVVDSRELINSVTRLNNKVRPIFAYSGGAKVNRYLLDFMSYQNRAWSQFIKERGQIHKGLGDFYAKIKDPVFLNLRYQLNGLPQEEVFPRALPDFYRNAEFTIYGTYDNENEFSMQLLGDVENETKELIFSRSLSDAEKGGPEIMKGYAFNKIYHLISDVTTKGQDPQTLKEIQSLSQRYGVTTPYSPDLQSID